MRGPALALLFATAACTPGGDAAGRGDSSAGAFATSAVRRGNVEVTKVIVPAPAPAADSVSTVAAYFQVTNRGAEADTLYRVEAPEGRASMHDHEMRGGRQAMVPILMAVLPGGTVLRFVPGARHVMIEGVRRPVAAGDSLALTLYFRRAGSIPVVARVIEYADLEAAVGAEADARAGR